MAKLTRADRDALAEKRLLANLKAHGIATTRTLEQKISDGGPFNQRIDPHVLTPARNRLVGAGKIKIYEFEGAAWYFLSRHHAGKTKRAVWSSATYIPRHQRR